MNERLLEKKDLTLCAVSGGVDSMYLLCRLRELGYPVAAAHYNHKLRGAESDRDEVFVRSFCMREGIRFYAGSGDVAAYAGQNGLGTEESARLLRYAFLEKIAEEIGAARIATAHTADDNAETLLLHLARGAGLRGLGGIPPVRGRIVRPMLHVTRDVAEKYLIEHAIAHVEDSTNESGVYARNRVRRGAMPALKTVNPAFCEAVTRTTVLLREDEAFLQGLAESFIERHGTKTTLDAKALRDAPFPVASRAVRSMAGRELSVTHVQAVLKAARDGGAADVPGLRIERRGDVLVFGVARAQKLPERKVVPGSVLELPEAGLWLSCRILEKCPEVHNQLNIFHFQCENICGSMAVTSRRNGDRLRLCGRSCTRPVRRLLAEAGIPEAERDSVPVLRDENGVMAVYGVGAAQRVCARSGDERIIEIKMLRQRPDGE